MHEPIRTASEVRNNLSASLCRCGKRANHGTSKENWTPAIGDKS